MNQRKARCAVKHHLCSGLTTLLARAPGYLLCAVAKRCVSSFFVIVRALLPRVDIFLFPSSCHPVPEEGQFNTLQEILLGDTGGDTHTRRSSTYLYRVETRTAGTQCHTFLYALDLDYGGKKKISPSWSKKGKMPTEKCSSRKDHLHARPPIHSTLSHD